MINDDIQKEVDRQVKFLHRSLKELHLTRKFIDDFNLCRHINGLIIHGISDYNRILHTLIKSYGLKGNFTTGRFYLIVSNILFGTWTNMKYPNWSTIDNILTRNYNIMKKLIKL